MPLLSPWAEKVSKKGEEIFLAVWAFTTFIPFFRQAATAVTGSPDLWGEASWNEYGTFQYVSGFVGYLVLGHYFRKYVPEMSWKKTLAVAVPLWAVGYAVTALWFWMAMPKDFPVEGPIDIAVRMETSWQFYLMHMFFLIFFHQIVSGWGLSTPVHILVTAVLTFTVSSVISRLISMIPGGKYIVG